ncbi:MAG: hypothetical protein K2W96_13345 [Gemmataceae bacterium]|nr:hypothetical protein [Gemmataceae bacterium]
MSSLRARRDFLSAAGLTGLAALIDALPPVRGAASPARAIAAVSDDLEPLVRLVEETPRDKIIERAVDRIKAGTSYEELLAALLLAGVRGIQPRPVGFKFHAVLVVHSAHQASLAARDKERWLPLLWSLDNFKSAQERNRREGDWRLAPAPAKLPAGADAASELAKGLDEWDEERTDRAVTALAREEGAAAAFATLWHVSCRDFRDIGHKAIYAAGAYRALNAIGWRHAEPVLRSLAYALLDHEGTNPAKRDADQDRDGRANLPRARKLAAALHGKKPAEGMLALLREASADGVSKDIGKRLLAGASPAAVWDGLALAGGEWLLRSPGIVSLHALTSLNALRYIGATAPEPWQRAYALLQAGAFTARFRDALPAGGKHKLDALEPAEAGKEPVAAILANVRKEPLLAARQALSLDAKKGRELMAAARTLVFAKGRDSHDYKFSSAVFEDWHLLAPAARRPYLAAATNWLRGSGEKDSPLFTRAQSALRG